MRRTLNVPDMAACEQIAVALVGTVNAYPIWGREARTLLLDGIEANRAEDGTVDLDLSIAEWGDGTPGLEPWVVTVYRLADWSSIEPSLPLAAP